MKNREFTQQEKGRIKDYEKLLNEGLITDADYNYLIYMIAGYKPVSPFDYLKVTLTDYLSLKRKGLITDDDMEAIKKAIFNNKRVAKCSAIEPKLKLMQNAYNKGEIKENKFLLKKDKLIKVETDRTKKEKKTIMKIIGVSLMLAVGAVFIYQSFISPIIEQRNRERAIATFDETYEACRIKDKDAFYKGIDKLKLDERLESEDYIINEDFCKEYTKVSSYDEFAFRFMSIYSFDRDNNEVIDSDQILNVFWDLEEKSIIEDKGLLDISKYRGVNGYYSEHPEENKTETVSGSIVTDGDGKGAVYAYEEQTRTCTTTWTYYGDFAVQKYVGYKYDKGVDYWSGGVYHYTDPKWIPESWEKVYYKGVGVDINGEHVYYYAKLNEYYWIKGFAVEKL